MESSQQNSFMFYGNFLDAIEQLPEEDRANACYQFCRYALNDELPQDKSLAMFCIGVRYSVHKYQGRGGARIGAGRPKKSESLENQKNQKNQKNQNTQTETKTETETETEINIHTSTSGGGLPPTEEIISGWNSVARKYHLSTIKTLDERRLRSFRQRYEQSGVSNLAEFFALIDGFLNDSLFLQGKRMCKDGNDWVTQDTDWRADFDFFLQRKSFTKALEGGYDDPTVRKFKEAKHATTEK